ncbi:MAG TPA: Smr/MutS family protein [Hyphomicrobiaceae bacterium]
MTSDEAELWRQLAHSIDKVRTKPRVTAHSGEPAAPAPSPPAAPPTPKGGAAERGVAAHTPRQMPASAKGQAPRPAEFDRRTLRQVAAGKVRIDARLDLHGLQQETAHARLRAFLASCHANGHRMVLVITGKGRVRPGVRPLAADLPSYRARGGEGSDPSSCGVLRRSVPQWLDEPEFRAIVLGYAAAGVRHGGEGALYIRLRKAREA